MLPIAYLLVFCCVHVHSHSGRTRSWLKTVNISDVLMILHVSNRKLQASSTAGIYCVYLCVVAVSKCTAQRRVANDAANCLRCRREFSSDRRIVCCSFLSFFLTKHSFYEFLRHFQDLLFRTNVSTVTITNTLNIKTKTDVPDKTKLSSKTV